MVNNTREQVGVPGDGKELFFSSFVVPARTEVLQHFWAHAF